MAKVLADRLKPLLQLLVLDFQGAAVEGRHIQDLSLMPNKLLDSRFLSKDGGLMFKLDFLRRLIVLTRVFLTVCWKAWDSRISGDHGYGHAGK